MMKILFRNVIVLLLVGANCACLAQQKSVIPFGNNKAVGKFANIRGFKMYYEIYGNGEPLLMIHGNGGSINSFVNQIPYFSKQYKVIIADSRAQGKSVDDKDSLSYEMMADDLSALLDTLHLDNVNVIGWSDGGINGLLLAMRHPDKVKKLAVTGANLWPDSTAVDPFVYNITMASYDSLIKLPQTPAVKTQVKLNRILSFEPNITLQQVSAIKCPSLIIGGDHDVILPAHTLAIANAIPNAYLWIIPNSGHSTPFAKKDQFNAIVSDFFKQPFRKIEGTGMFN